MALRMRVVDEWVGGGYGVAGPVYVDITGTEATVFEAGEVDKASELVKVGTCFFGGFVDHDADFVEMWLSDIVILGAVPEDMGGCASDICCFARRMRATVRLAVLRVGEAVVGSDTAREELVEGALGRDVAAVVVGRLFVDEVVQCGIQVNDWFDANHVFSVPLGLGLDLRVREVDPLVQLVHDRVPGGLFNACFVEAGLVGDER